ncbi:MAG: carbamoyl-phosphate synthase domain-containing protein, partial [Elusimicrobiota bacterium]
FTFPHIGNTGVNEEDIEALNPAARGLIVREDIQLAWPRAETPTHLMTMAFDPDLDDCVVIALRQMVDLASELPPGSVHLIVGGHNHEAGNGVVNEIPIVRAGANGRPARKQ